MTPDSIGFIWTDGKRFWVLDFEQIKHPEQFVPPEAKHTKTVQLNVYLEKVLNGDCRTQTSE